MDKNNNLYNKSIDLAKEIVFLYRELDNKPVEKELIKQFLRSGTSIGANVSEAQGSISEADYLSKIHQAYKELLETDYWIELLRTLGDIEPERASIMTDKLNELSKILYTITKNIRNKRQKIE